MADSPTGRQTAHQMGVDILGRLANITVPHKDALIPVFEAVVNSIHSTQDAYGEQVSAQGRIRVDVVRLKQSSLVEDDTQAPVIGFRITDNGLGFNDTNLQAFETADTQAKADRGGKGIGRFSWLVVFHQAKIQSVFKNAENESVKRSFKFVPKSQPVQDFTEEYGEEEIVSTTVELTGVKATYDAAVNSATANLSAKIAEHCFSYLILRHCPVTHVVDGDKYTQVNQQLENLKIDVSEFELGEHKLLARHVQQPLPSVRRVTHQGHLCAHNRVVTSFPLADVSELDNTALVMDGQPTAHQVFVSGPSLDEAVDPSRTRLILPDGDPIFEGSGVLDLAELRTRIGERMDEELLFAIEAQREDNYTKIEHHVRTEQPQYRGLLNKRRTQVRRNVKWANDPKAIDLALYREQQRWEEDVRNQQADFEKELADGSEDDVEKYTEQLLSLVSENNELGQASLIKYVIRRRAVIKVLDSLTAVKPSPFSEEDVHSVVFPVRTQYDEISFDDHNLWLVDDTLSFYEFVASDVSFTKNRGIDGGSLQRPDILAFKTGDPFQHIAIVEFKRPGRDDDNPVSQLVEYGEQLRSGGGFDAGGHSLPAIPNSVRIDAYAVCSLTPRMEKLLVSSPGDINKVEGEFRWFGTHRMLNMTYEVLDYRAFIQRAKQRNAAFFDKLNLP